MRMSWCKTFGHFWRLCVAPFFRDPAQPRVWVKPLLVVLGTLAMTAASVAMTIWNRSFYDALESKQYAEFLSLLGIFLGLASFYIALALLRLWVTRSFCMQWRTWATQRWTEAWLSHQRFYHLEITREKTDNPDQRISEDLKQTTVQTLELFLGLLTNGLSLVSFAGMLWTLSGPLEWAWGGWQISIPGYMVWVSLLYAIVGSWWAHRIGQPLQQLNFHAERCEADFRSGLFRLREHAESIALYGGEKAEGIQLGRRFDDIIRLWNEMTTRRLRLLAFSTGYSQIALIFPILIAAPQYFLTAMSLGALMQMTSAFRQVNDALSWFVDNYPALSQWQASVQRLLSFWESLQDPHGQSQAQRLVRQAGQDRLHSLASLQLELPCGTPLLQVPQFALEQGRRILLSGPSGSGKSTLLRAFAGLWPFGQGELHHPQGGLLFLPQRPYLPTGTLRQVLAFPSPPDLFSDAELKEALEAAEVGHLVSALDEERHWTFLLSGGEQQRLGFARVFLQKPRWLFMDESSSALDEQNESILFDRLHERLPHCAIVTVAHRPSLARFHHESWRVTPDKQGSRLTIDPLPAT